MQPSAPTPHTSSVSPIATFALEVRLLGAFGLCVYGEPITVGSMGARRVLALLLLRSSRPLERALLAGELWPEAVSEARALFYLRRALTELRQALGPEAHRLQTPTPTTLRFELGSDGWCDVLVFDAAVKATKNEVLTEQAIALYRGPLLETWEEPWVLGEREARAEHFLQTHEWLAARRRQEGDLPPAARLLHEVLRRDPLRESACRALLEVLADSGDFAGVEREYQQLRRQLREQLGSNPSAKTIAIYERLRAIAKEEINPLPQREAVPTRRLPCPLTRLIGREAEIAVAAKAVQNYRLVTLLGPGGVGKTRLAIAVAEELVSSFTDGVWFADLAATRQPEQIWQSVAVALRLAPTPGQPPDEAVCRYLSEKQLLLLLDNGEHLIEACAELAARTLQSCPELKILATSRQPLRISGEQLVVVEPLEIPAPHDEALEVLKQCASVRLLLDRIESVAPRFRLTASQVSPIAQICRHLEGIPLALELVAVRFRTFSATEIAARLGDRFGLLTGGDRTLPRQQTLQATMDWSYSLLDDAAQKLLARLSVFVGGWTAEAAKTVCQEAPLETLLEHSLIVAEDEAPRQTRYRFLETTREYAAQKLSQAGEREKYQCRHAAYYAALARKSEPELHRANAAAIFDLLERELPNLQAAMQRLIVQGKAARSLRVAVALEAFWLSRGNLPMGCALLSDALATSAMPSGRRRSGLLALGWLELWRGNHATPRLLLREALRSARKASHGSDTIKALRGLGYVAHQTGANRRAEPLWRHALAIARAQNDAPYTALLLHDLGNLYKQWGDTVKALVFYDESIALNRSLCFPRRVAMSELCKGIALVEQWQIKEVKEAIPVLEASITKAQSLGDQNILALAERNLGNAFYILEDYVQAVVHFEKSLSLNRERGALVEVNNISVGLAACFRHLYKLNSAHNSLIIALKKAFQLDDYRHHYYLLQESILLALVLDVSMEMVASLVGVADHLYELVGYTADPTPELVSAIRDVRAALDEQTYTACRAFGYGLSLGEIESFLIRVFMDWEGKG